MLAIVDDVYAELGLFARHLIDRPRHTRTERHLVVGLARVPDLQQRDEIVGARQAPDVRREDAVATALHQDSPSLRIPRFS